MSDERNPGGDGARHPLPADLVHDLRTPLNQIIGYSEMLEEQAQEAGQEVLVPDLQKVRTAGRQLLALIEGSFIPIQAPSAQEMHAVPAVEFKPAGGDLAVHGSAAKRDVDGSDGLGQNAFLLVVDDQEANRDVLSRRLAHEGYASASAENGRQALGMLAEGSYDLVLLDIMMPEMDGYEVLLRLKADDRLRHIPVIMISALSELESVVRCIEMGAEDYLSKPFNPVLLKARIGACLEKKHARDREMRLLDEVQQSYKRLQELEKLRDDLTHMIIHDLRTPLTSVISGMQTLEMVGDLNEEQRDVMGIALSGGETLLGMINDLLDVEKLEAGSMQLDYGMTSPSALVDSAVNQVASLAENRHLVLTRDVAADLPAFLGDESKLRRTLVNLLGNSIKFTPAGGTVAIRVVEPADGLSIEFSVTDSGEGIPPEAFGRIFEKFGQVESRKSGRTMSTGLGLTFCKLAVEAHGGRIEVESAPGEGSTFRFTIPLESTPA